MVSADSLKFDEREEMPWREDFALRLENGNIMQGCRILRNDRQSM